MEQIKMFCDECGVMITEEDVCEIDYKGRFLHIECLLREAKPSLSMLTKEDLINILNHADGQRLTSFYVSFVNGKKYKYVCHKEAYPHVFCIFVDRQEVVNELAKRP